MKTTFDFKFDLYQTVKQHGKLDTHKDRSQEKLSIKKTCNSKKLVNNQNLNKSSFYFIDINAYHCNQHD